MKAVLNGTVLAEAPKEELVHIEGNWYFPPASVKAELLKPSATPYTCPWKGDCQYFSVHDGEVLLQDRAWSYPEIHPSAVARVGHDFAGYVAFWKEVQVTN
jgi:uncharacterized protein (DUF427 family)